MPPEVNVSQISLTLSDGSTVFFEEDTEEQQGPRPAGIVQDTVLSFDLALDSIRKATGAIITAIRSALPEEPDELEVEFGLKARLEANGFLVAKAASEAHYKVKLKWEKRVKHDREH
jgi:hypothetical protein